MANKIAPEKTPAAQAFPFEREVEQWKYKAAVSAAKPFVKNYQKSAAELSKILFIAHTALARLGGDRKSENANTYSFSSFCDDIGMSRATAMLYMRLYDPKDDRVRTPEELLAQKRANTPKLVSASETRIAHAMETGDRPAGWTEADEREFRKRSENRRFSELAEKWGKNQIRWTRKSDRDYFAEAMANAKQFTRFSLASKEQTHAQFEIFEAVSHYFSSFEEPGIRLAAAYNLGLKIRDIINELASMENEMESFDCGEKEA